MKNIMKSLAVASLIIVGGTSVSFASSGTSTDTAFENVAELEVEHHINGKYKRPAKNAKPYVCDGTCEDSSDRAIQSHKDKMKKVDADMEVVSFGDVKVCENGKCSTVEETTSKCLAAGNKASFCKFDLHLDLASHDNLVVTDPREICNFDLDVSEDENGGTVAKCVTGIESYVSADGSKVFKYPSPYAMRDEMSYVGGKVRPELEPYPDLREDYYGELVPDAVNNAWVARMCGAKSPTDFTNLSFSYDDKAPNAISFVNHTDGSSGRILNGYVINRTYADGDELTFVVSDETIPYSQS